MLYRIYDEIDKKWIEDGFYLAPNGDLYKKGNSLFGRVKLIPIYEDRYICQNFINLHDKNKTPIYEGDFLECQVEEDRKVSGVVVYSTELSSYVILCHSIDEYYTLGSYISEYIEIIGNVFDGYTDERYKGQQAL